MMTPIDKARDLMERIYWGLPNNGSFTGINNVKSRWEEARYCAKVAVVEMIDEVAGMQKVFPDSELFETYLEFWQETLEAIKSFKSEFNVTIS
jgi:hypothetical protein